MKNIENLFLEFLESKKLEIKETTVSAYLTKANKYIYPLFKNEIPDENKITHYLYTLQRDDNLSGKTIYDAVMLINAFMLFLYNQKEVKSFIKISKPKFVLKDVEVFNDNDIQKIENYVTCNWGFTIFGILLDLYSGLRIGELCALKWQDIDLNNGVLHIANTIQRIKNTNDELTKTKIIIDTPKTPNSIRLVPLPDFYIPVMQKFSAPANRYALTATTQPMEPRLLQEKYKSLLKIIGINYRKFHTLRHTFATKALLGGMDIKTLSEILGHVNVAYTLKTYVHLDIQTKRNQLNSIYEGKNLVS